MDEDTERYLRLAQREKEDAQLKLMQLQNEYGQMSSFGNKEEINSMETQLDLTEVLDNIHHLLQGHILTRNKEGNLV